LMKGSFTSVVLKPSALKLTVVRGIVFRGSPNGL
jgi:hypothetical protein